MQARKACTPERMPTGLGSCWRDGRLRSTRMTTSANTSGQARGMSTLALIAALALVALAGVGGFAVGQSPAPTEDEAQREKREAYKAALADSQRDAYAAAHEKGMDAGADNGRAAGKKAGATRGAERGQAEAEERAAAAQAAAQAEAAEANTAVGPPPGGYYTDELPSGEPGYVLPESQRTLSCVGIDADTGQCVGD
jgi:hypothetical protein